MTKGMIEKKRISQINMGPQSKRLEDMANMHGAIAADEGIKFHDNPYRISKKYGWLYSAWEYGYMHSEDFLGE